MEHLEREARELVEQRLLIAKDSHTETAAWALRALAPFLVDLTREEQLSAVKWLTIRSCSDEDTYLRSILNKPFCFEGQFMSSGALVPLPAYSAEARSAPKLYTRIFLGTKDGLVQLLRRYILQYPADQSWAKAWIQAAEAFDGPVNCLRYEGIAVDLSTPSRVVLDNAHECTRIDDLAEVWHRENEAQALGIEHLVFEYNYSKRLGRATNQTASLLHWIHVGLVKGIGLNSTNGGLLPYILAPVDLRAEVARLHLTWNDLQNLARHVDQDQREVGEHR